MYRAGRIGCSHALVLLCASSTVVAAPWPRWHMDAAEFGQRVRNRRMRPEWLRLTSDRLALLQRDMTGGAAVHHAHSGSQIC